MEKEVVIIKEYLFSIDDFERPKELFGKDAIFVLFVRLLLLNPGTIQSHPDMGVGLISKWRYSYFENIGDLQLEIQKQIEKYLPQLQGAEINLRADNSANKELIVEMTANGILYKVKTDSINNTIKLSDI